MHSQPFFTGLLALLFLASCASSETEYSEKSGPPLAAEYPDHVGDIEYDPTVDKADFELCEVRTYQYYNFGDGVKYRGERPAMLRHIKENYSPASSWDGYVSIRFVVNCMGETDRFRMRIMDYQYQEILNSDGVGEALLTAVRTMGGWLPKAFDEKTYPYYQYLTFRIENGEIKEVTP